MNKFTFSKDNRRERRCRNPKCNSAFLGYTHLNEKRVVPKKCPKCKETTNWRLAKKVIVENKIMVEYGPQEYDSIFTAFDPA